MSNGTSEQKPSSVTLTQETARDLAQKIEESILWSKKVFEGQEKVRKYLFWNTVGNVIRLAIILIPIVIGFLVLPPLIRNFTALLQGGAGNGTGNPFGEVLDLLKP